MPGQIPGVEKAPAKAQKAVKFMLPAKKAKQLRFMSDEKAKLQGSVPRPAVAAIKEDLWTEPGSPKTPVCHAVAVSELDLITPHKDIVEVRTPATGLSMHEATVQMSAFVRWLVPAFVAISCYGREGLVSCRITLTLPPPGLPHQIPHRP